MIFVSVGTQFPFDRLIKALDTWAVERGVTDIVAQIGPSSYRPAAMKAFDSIPPNEFKKYQNDATLFVSHAVMGAIISAMELGKPLIIMPRLYKLGEHRNDHQLATVQQLRGKPGIYVATNGDELCALLDRRDELQGSRQTSSLASPELINSLKSFLAMETAGHDARSRRTR